MLRASHSETAPEDASDDFYEGHEEEEGEGERDGAPDALERGQLHASVRSHARRVCSQQQTGLSCVLQQGLRDSAGLPCTVLL